MRIFYTFLFFSLWVGCEENPSSNFPDLARLDLGSSDLRRGDSSSDLPKSETGNDTSVRADVPADIRIEPQLSNAVGFDLFQNQLTELDFATAVTGTGHPLPFLTASYNLTDPALHYVHLDAVVDANILTVSRDENPMIPGEYISVSGNVVSLDPTRFEMSCEYFQTGFLNATVTFPTFDPTRSFTLFWSKVSTGSNNKSVAYISARFETNETVYLERVAPNGTVLGHACLIESVGETFSAQQATAAMGVGIDSVDLSISQIDPAQSVLFASHQATRSQSKPGFSQISCRLDSDLVTCERGLSEDEIVDIRVQVVTFPDRTTVEHLTVDIPDGAGEVVISVPGIRPDDVVLLGQIGVIGEIATDADDKTHVTGSYVEAIIGTDSVTFRRGLPMIGNIRFYPQIVRF